MRVATQQLDLHDGTIESGLRQHAPVVGLSLGLVALRLGYGYHEVVFVLGGLRFRGRRTGLQLSGLGICLVFNRVGFRIDLIALGMELLRAVLLRMTTATRTAGASSKC